MSKLSRICDFLEDFAPPDLAEEWDNVGLLVGDRDHEIESIMTCLTVTPTTVAEAQQQQVDLIVTHHPMPFRPLKRITTDQAVGKILYSLIAQRTAVYSPHTSFDSTAGGINQQLAEGLQLEQILPLRPFADNLSVGGGRYGAFAEPRSCQSIAGSLKQLLGVDGLHVVNPRDDIKSLAVACGSAGEFLADARRVGCDALLIGETNFHTCLEAEASGTTLFLPGHYASERFAIEWLAELLQKEFQNLKVWASRDEHDPLQWCD